MNFEHYYTTKSLFSYWKKWRVTRLEQCCTTHARLIAIFYKAQDGRTYDTTGRLLS